MATINIGTVNVENGQATKSYTIPSNFKVGESTIRAVYLENDHYQRGEDTSTLTVKKPTALTVSNTLGSIGKSATFKATVEDVVAGSNINVGTVQFKLGGNNLGSPVSATGTEFILNIAVPSGTETGDEITAVYQGTSTYDGCVSTTAGIITLRKDINITVPTVSANRGTTPTITATCTDGQGQPVTTGSAVLKIDGVQSGESVNIDTTNGTFTFTSYSVGSSATVGSHTITVEYAENDTYNEQTGTGSLIVRTPTTITCVDTSANPGEQGKSIQVNVRDNNNNNVTEGNVQITVGSGSAVTAAVSNGVATISYDVPQAASGSISFSAVYVENNNYQGSSTSSNGTITIRQAVTVAVDEVSANLTDDITLSATVTSGNTDVDEGQLTFTIDDD